MKQIKVTLIKSTAKKLAMHQNNVRGLGLRRMHHSVVVKATPEVLGMVNQSSHMFKVEEVR